MIKHILTGFIPGLALGATVVIIINKIYNHPISNRRLNEVLFTNNTSGCCSVQNQVSHCENLYCKGTIEARLIQLINSANTSINLSMYIFTCNSLANAIIEAHARGVIVRIITEQSMLYSTNSQAPLFSQKGIIVFKFKVNIKKNGV